MKPYSKKVALRTRAGQRDFRREQKEYPQPSMRMTPLALLRVWLALPTYTSPRFFLNNSNAWTGRYSPENIRLAEDNKASILEVTRLVPKDDRDRSALIRRASLETEIGILGRDGSLVFNPIEHKMKLEERRRG